MLKADYSLDACTESVEFQIETLHEDPIRLLGEYTLRARQDPFFNRRMVDALIEYIDAHGINWTKR